MRSDENVNENSFRNTIVLDCFSCAGNIGTWKPARMFAVGKLGCFVLFDSIQQAVLDEKYEALHFHVEPSSPPSLQQILTKNVSHHPVTGC